MQSHAILSAQLNDETLATQHCETGNDLLKAKAYDAAKQEYLKALEFNPNMSRAHFGLVFIALQLKNYVEVVRLGEKAIELHCENMGILNTMAAALMDLSKYDQAITILNKSLDIEQNNPLACSYLGVISYETGDMEQAVRFFRQAVQFAPQDHSHLCDLGNALFQNGQYDDSINVLKQAVVLKQEDIQVLIRLAQVYSARSQYSVARNYLQEIFRIKPNCEEAYYELGLIFEREQDYKNALENYLRSVESDRTTWIANNRGDAYYGMGNCLWHLGKINASINAYNEAIKLTPDDPDPYYAVAYLLEQKGFQNEARRAWEKVVELDAGPKGQHAREKLQQFRS